MDRFLASIEPISISDWKSSTFCTSRHVAFLLDCYLGDFKWSLQSDICFLDKSDRYQYRIGTALKMFAVIAIKTSCRSLIFSWKDADWFRTLLQKHHWTLHAIQLRCSWPLRIYCKQREGLSINWRAAEWKCDIDVNPLLATSRWRSHLSTAVHHLKRRRPSSPPPPPSRASWPPSSCRRCEVWCVPPRSAPPGSCAGAPRNTPPLET